MTEKKYLSSLHFLRGFAALAVCLFHFTNGNSTYFSDHNLIKTIGSYGHYGVEIFFVISGVVIPFSMHKGGYELKNFKIFLLKRIIRIEPPYLISIIIVIVLGYASTLSSYYRGEPFQPNLINLLCHLGYLNAFFQYDWLNPVYWTLAIEFQYYLLIALIFPLLSSKKTYVWIFTIIIFNLLSLALPSHNFIFSYSLYFTIGIIMHKFLVGEIPSYLYYSIISILSIFLFIKFDLPGIISGLIPVILIFSQLENKIFKFFGNISYSVYLLHVPVGMRIINLSENFISSDIARYSVILFATTCTIAVSYIFYTYVELPCKISSHKIKYKCQPTYSM